MNQYYNFYHDLENSKVFLKVLITLGMAAPSLFIKFFPTCVYINLLSLHSPQIYQAIKTQGMGGGGKTFYSHPTREKESFMDSCTRKKFLRMWFFFLLSQYAIKSLRLIGLF